MEAHWSGVVLFLAWVQVATGRLSRPEIGTLTVIGMAIAAAALYYLSILLHEFGHALWAVRERWKVEKITLWGLGGIAWVGPRGPYASAGARFRVVAAGPLVTVALILLFGATNRAGEALDWPNPVVDLLGLLTLGNVLLLLFNLAPALPLDGGQMLQAWLWGRPGTGADAVQRRLLRTGAVSAYGAVGVGILLLATGRLFAGYLVAICGVQILLMSSWYYRVTARATARATGRSGGSPRRSEVVGDLVRERALDIPEASSVNDFLDQTVHTRGTSTRAFAVTRDGELVGYTSIGLVHQVAEANRGGPVVDAMVPRDEAIQLDPNTPLTEALEQLPNVSDVAIVVEDGRVTGILPRQAIADALLEVADRARGGSTPTAPPR